MIVSDGRSDAARNQIRTYFTSTVGDGNYRELWVVYDMEASLKTDVRNPKRKVAWSGANVETLFVKLPSKRRQTLVVRDAFNRSGESTNFCRSYSGVPFRTLAEIPRLTTEAKTRILGKSAVGEFIPRGRLRTEVDQNGHPLFWGEWKTVSLFKTILRDFQVAEVVDLTPGSGAACLAALACDVFYIGFAHNDAHCEWLQDIIQRHQR